MSFPNPYFTIFELMVLILATAGFRHAWQRGRHVVWHLLAGMVFGVLLEWATIQQLAAYEYGRFPLQSYTPKPYGKRACFPHEAS